mgnify:CR=1 FL=1
MKRKVIHVYIYDTNSNYYFGSLTAIYIVLTPDQVGIKYQSLKNYFNSSGSNEYRNKKCTIIKDYLITSPKE